MGEARASQMLLIDGEFAAAPLAAHPAVTGLSARFSVSSAIGIAAAVAELRLDPPDCALLDLDVLGTERGAAICALGEYLPCAPLIALARVGDTTAAREAIRAGADDCLEKDTLDARGLCRAVELAAERSAARSRLMTLAHRDLLTGLANRSPFQQSLCRALARARRSHQVLGLLYVDLDDFKAINNGHGYDAGDANLKAVAARFAAELRLGDTLARVGGDEFALILENLASHEAAAAVGRKLLETLRAPIAVGRESFSVLASIGIAFQPADGDSAEDLILSADLAMHAAKHRGGGRICSFSGLLPDRGAGLNATHPRRLAAGQCPSVLYPGAASLRVPTLV